jgi:SOS-response transcriptional repressor LexA
MSAPAALRPTTRARIYCALVNLADQHGRPPTIREIATAAGLSSTGRMSYHLDRLVELGLLQNLGGARCYVAVRRETAPAADRLASSATGSDLGLLAAASPPSGPWGVAAAVDRPGPVAAASPPGGPWEARHG